VVGGYNAFFLRKLSVIAGLDAACGGVPVRSKLSESVSASGVSRLSSRLNENILERLREQGEQSPVGETKLITAGFDPSRHC
jgi:hypothetical protein